MARFIDSWSLAGRSHEEPREQIREARMMLPVGQQTSQQLRATQEWTVRRGGASQGDVVASPCAGMPPVEHELLRAETGQARLLVEDSCLFNHFLPVVRRVDVHL